MRNKQEKNPSGFYFIRHGESVNNQAQLVNGWTDCDLTKKRKKSAQLIGELLKNYAINRIVTSDLKRAVKTAQIIANEIDYKREIESHIELRDKNYLQLFN